MEESGERRDHRLHHPQLVLKDVEEVDGERNWEDSRVVLRECRIGDGILMETCASMLGGPET